MKIDIHEAALACLEEKIVDKKIQLSNSVLDSCKNGFNLSEKPPKGDMKVGMPERPEMVPPNELPKRGFVTEKERMCLVHAIAHIEFNAINLAWDAIYRFRNMPKEYYKNWLSVAKDETRHFTLLRSHLNKESYDYGDFVAHNGLWKMAEQTSEDVLHRMAIIPRVLEARGLDVTPVMIKKFRDAKELEIAKTLELIYCEEIDHVRIGNRWFRYLCTQRNLSPLETFIELLKHYNLEEFRGCLNRPARKKAGFSEEELDLLQRSNCSQI